MKDETKPGSGAAPPPSRWPAPHPMRPEVRYDISAFHDVYDRAQSATQMSDRPMRRQRHYLIPDVIRQCRDVPGEAAEVGCFRGLSAYVACETYRALSRSIEFHIFDSFEGLSKPVVEDHSDYLPQRYREAGRLFACSEETVRQNLVEFDFIHFHPGWIPDRFDDVKTRKFSYVHIDVDLLHPTSQSLAFFWPRLSVGGAIVLDDFATLMFPGARRAVLDYFEGRSDVFVVETAPGSAVAIRVKPEGRTSGPGVDA